MKKQDNFVKVLTVIVAIVTIFVAITCSINFGKFLGGKLLTEVETMESFDGIVYDTQDDKELGIVVNFLMCNFSIGLAFFTVTYSIDKFKGKEYFVNTK